MARRGRADLDRHGHRGLRPRPDPEITDLERPYWEQVQAPGIPPTPPSTVDVEVTDGDELDFGGGARIVGIPGHTPGSIAIHLPKHCVLFTGKAIRAANLTP